MDILKYIQQATPYDLEIKYTPKHGGMVDIKLSDGKYGTGQSIYLERIQNSMGDMVEETIKELKTKLDNLIKSCEVKHKKKGDGN